jgi:excisionase family DNA binding protein
MARTSAPRKLETVASGAEYANVSQRTIRRWIAEGRLRAYRAGPRLVRIDRAELDRLIRPIPTAGNVA